MPKAQSFGRRNSRLAPISGASGSEYDLRARSVEFQLLFERHPQPLWIFDRKTLAFLAVNHAAVKYYGYSRREFLRMNLRDIRPSGKAPHLLSWLESVNDSAADAGPFRKYEAKHRKKDGTCLSVRVTMRWIVFQGKASGLASIHDITDLKRAEETVKHFPGCLLRSQDEERRRIARELHDATGQSLSALSLNLGLVMQSAGALDERARRALSESIALAEQCAHETRTISYLLHPPLLDELGLEAAVRGYVEGFARRTGVQVDLQLSPELGPLPKAAETAIFRIVQECLTNIHRHSGSPVARIRLCRDRSYLCLTVEDQGSGIQWFGNQTANNAKLGVGIPGMKERVRELGGRLKITSDESGASVRVMLPAKSVALPAAG